MYLEYKKYCGIKDMVVNAAKLVPITTLLSYAYFMYNRYVAQIKELPSCQTRCIDNRVNFADLPKYNFNDILYDFAAPPCNVQKWGTCGATGPSAPICPFFQPPTPCSFIKPTPYVNSVVSPCNKPGPTGTTGATGVTGPVGPTGTTGCAPSNVLNVPSTCETTTKHFYDSEDYNSEDSNDSENEKVKCPSDREISETCDLYNTVRNYPTTVPISQLYE
jgi:hypothetical protein